ncbi:IS30 family transposase [Amycolatopsis sp. WQ 127309]|uniref:IS30 family transposase n=1 Tax=Amycolatopsis sp. WQ 127309 TaxID=2932773 RepID=UPI001FF2A34C|nr:IS30 family transposase [Amycolatopsis sp. WQ 127309]UOZ08794.1 IS30 family transposase [Amycolatopsis sp. WQ 127309]UOZ09402.1 IS30 family transposase [Amycolatopsis sp. WQ 127309]
MVRAHRWLPRSVQLEFWDHIRAGKAAKPAARAAGFAPATGVRLFRHAGGVSSNAPTRPGPLRLSITERDEIACLTAAGHGPRAIGRMIGRSASTVSRELARNTGLTGNYRPSSAQHRAEHRAKRPKTAKLAADPVLRAVVQAGLNRKWSPRQISERLALDFPDRPEMRVSHETIYQSLYVQSRGALRRELTAALRTGRALRMPRRQTQARRERPSGRIQDMVNISERPAEAADRAVPGHWEGDLILGKDNRSAIGTLVERSTRFVMLLHLPDGRDAATVAAAMTEMIATLPPLLLGSLTWDQGKEMAHHRTITLATGLDIYFCDPHSPWQRGSNENTNGLLRQYFPKGTDLSQHTAEDLAEVAAELNGRPRETLGWRTPAEVLTKLLLDQPTTGVATTA